MTNKDLAQLIFPHIDKDINYYEEKYPNRDLKEGSVVSRFGPSPTGFVHIGSLYMSYIARKYARQNDGIFYLRIEDTDQKRSVENGITDIIRDLENFGISFDEGMISETESKGNYGPYLQSERKEIYQTYAKYLIEEGLAYPCFLSSDELEEARQLQEEYKERIGCYGKYAKYRNMSVEEVSEKIKAGDEYIIRLKSPGNFEHKIEVKDLVKGKIEFPENDIDIVLIKGDGLPTYHFAHAVDDHLMRTTHVIRGEEWLSSVPYHLQLFRVLGFKTPKYAHIPPLMKLDETGVRRKLSKRKDPESAVSYYHKKGIPNEAVILYIMTVANSNFEEWYDCNKESSIDDFTFDFKKVSASGGLFDLEKLTNISKKYISCLKATEVYDRTLIYAKQYDLEFAELLEKYKDYTTNIFNIEREQKKPRKDYSDFGTIKNQVWYMFDELFTDNLEYDFQKIQDKSEIALILKTYIEEYYSDNDDKNTWFEKIKELCDKLGYASDMKAYKENPDSFKGNITDITTVIRVALTTKSMTPDLYELLRLIGKERITKRFEKAY